MMVNNTISTGEQLSFIPIITKCTHNTIKSTVKFANKTRRINVTCIRALYAAKFLQSCCPLQRFFKYRYVHVHEARTLSTECCGVTFQRIKFLHPSGTYIHYIYQASSENHSNCMKVVLYRLHRKYNPT